MTYERYFNLKYSPSNDDLICRFYIEPKYGVSFEKAASAVAAESSIGTWTDISTNKPYVKKLTAYVFNMDVHTGYIDIAYPFEAFEKGNVPQILSSIAGNVFGIKEVNNLKLYDVRFPKRMAKWFKGPHYGISGIRNLLGVKKRPLVGTIIKPKIGLNAKDHSKVAYDAWLGGCDIVKDDENLTNQRFNPFEKRFLATIKARDKAEKLTGEKKVYLTNVTAPVKEMLRRAKFVHDNGGEYVMVDIITIGWAGLQELLEYDDKLKLVVHAHCARYATLSRNLKHGFGILPIAKFTRLIGCDQLHSGTIVGKMEGGEEEVVSVVNTISKQSIPAQELVLGQEWGSIKPVFPVASGGIYPGHVPMIISKLGLDLIIQMDGGIHDHPKGTAAGAKAARAAVEAVMDGISLNDSRSSELQEALAYWSEVKF